MNEKSISIASIIKTFLSERWEPFSREDVAQFIESQGIDLTDAVRVTISELLRESHVFYSHDDVHFIHIGYFFESAEFCITPTANEIKQGLLVPGHRFVPFLSKKHYPFLIRISDDEGRRLRYRQVEWLVADAMPYISMFGIRNAFQYCISDSDRNAQIASKDPFDQIILLTVFDMQAFYDRHHFQHGDSIIVKVLDWKTGEYTIRYRSRAEEEAHAQELNLWSHQLEEELICVFEMQGAVTDVHDQLETAFFNANGKLTHQAGVSISSLIEHSERIQLTAMDGGYVILWYKDMQPEITFEYNDPTHTIRSGRIDSIDGILTDLGISLSEQEVEALIRDELFHGNGQYDHVVERIFCTRSENPFANMDQSVAFSRLLRTMWEQLQKKYNPYEDLVAGTLRGRMLLLKDRMRKLLRRIDKLSSKPNDIEPATMMQYADFMTSVRTLIEDLNDSQEMTIEDAEEMDRLIFQLEYQFVDWNNRLMEELTEVLQERYNDRGIPIMPDGEIINLDTLSERLYQVHTRIKLKMTFRGIRPPIWRRLYVPGDITVGDLSWVIQTIMQWNNLTTHSMNNGNMFYISKPADGVLRSHELLEDDYTLCDVLLRKDDVELTYHYEYDPLWFVAIEFEDVETGVDPVENIPRLIAGKRAAPLDHIGNLDAYKSLVKMVKSGDEVQLAEALTHLGADFDPEAFDLDYLNSQLNEWSRIK